MLKRYDLGTDAKKIDGKAELLLVALMLAPAAITMIAYLQASIRDLHSTYARCLRNDQEGR